MTELITRPEDLRPGDLFLGPIGGLVGLGVGVGQLVLGEAFRSGRLSVRHAGIVVDPQVMDGHATIAQAMPGGAEIVPLDPAAHWTEKCAWVRLPEDYPGQADDAAAIARLMVSQGVGYSYLSYASLAAWRFGVRAGRLQRYINRRRPATPVNPRVDFAHLPDIGVRIPCEAICSVFAEQAWTLTGKRVVEGTRPQAVTPGMLADALSWTADAVWARPRGVRLPARSWRV